MVLKRVEIGFSWDSARTTSIGVVRTRPVIILAAYN